MFEADLWDVDSLSRTNILQFGHCRTIAVQQNGFPAPETNECLVEVLGSVVQILGFRPFWNTDNGNSTADSSIRLLYIICFQRRQ